MYEVRPVRLEDIPGIQALAASSGTRMSTLPEDKVHLEARINQSIASFSGEEALSRQYLFVLVSFEDGHVAGISGIDAKAGNGGPFYNYRRDELIHASRQLNINNPIPVLYLSHELTGQTLLCSMMIEKSLTGTLWFDLLSRSRFMFMDQFREYFSNKVIVEIQGVQDEKGNAPFWDSLGKHFFNMDFAKADRISSTMSRTFIAELMPVYPIYVPLLTQQAQDVLGQVHPAAADNGQLLYREGFRISNLVDIFDGGPTLIADKNSLNTVKEKRYKYIREGVPAAGVKYLVCNMEYQNFRCTVTSLTDGMGDLLRVDANIIKKLNLHDGSEMAYSPL